MKNRPLKHKAENAFKFKSFSERISEIDIRKNALYYLEHANECISEEQTYFYQAMQKWSTLNMSVEFVQFHKKVRGIITLPQLLHRKEELTTWLLEYLDQSSSAALQPIFEIIVVLAKDLREEFYIYFPRFFDKLLVLLDTKDANQLEWVLVCLAFLFKTLRSFLKKELLIIFNKILPLLADNQPLHITNFAAECFSFIARDVQNKQKFVQSILKALATHPEGITGCGRLFFEMMRGVNENFHSTAPVFLTALLESLASSGIHRQLLFEVLVQTVTDMLSCISIKNMEVFWNVAYTTLDKFLEQTDGQIKDRDISVHHLLTLVGQVVEHKDGKYLAHINLMIKYLLKAIDENLEEPSMMCISRIAVLLLTSPGINITQLDASRLSKRMLNLNSTVVFADFIRHSVDYSQFELLILPDFLKYFERNFDEKLLSLLADIVCQKSPLCRTGINLDQWKSYPIVLKQKETLKNLASIVQTFDENDLHNDVDKFLVVALCYPHIVNIDETILCEKLAKIIRMCLKLVCDNNGNQKKLFYILSVACELCVHLNSEKVEHLYIINGILPFCNSIENVTMLRLLDLVLQSYKNQKGNFNEKLFKQIHEVISENLQSPFDEIRLLTAHIFTLFNHLPILKVPNEDETLYDVIYKSECAPITVHDYRTKLLYLQKLNFDSSFYQGIQESTYKMDVLKYLFSQYFINFKLLWEPINKIIVSFADGMDDDRFWQVCRHHLNFALAKTVGTEEKGLDQAEPESVFDIELIETDFNKNYERNDRADYVNYRLLLWKLLAQCETVYEAKHQEVVDIFFQFLNDEYNVVKRNKEEKRKKRGKKQTVEVDDDDNEEDESTQLPKATQKLLIAHLQLFAKIKNPKKLNLHQELHRKYIEFLQHRNFEVQKLALDCLMTYKHKYLMPYKEALYNIVNEKTFRGELLAFRIEKDDCVVIDVHREKFMAILLKILYTKMMTVPTKADKDAAQSRKSLIIRFLRKCQEHEIVEFLNLVFEPLLPLLEAGKNDARQIHQNIIIKSQSEFISDCQVPTNVLQSALNLVDIMREQLCGMVSESFVRHLINITICIGSIAEKSIVLQTRDNLTSYKNLRTLCLQQLTKIFEHVDTYSWSEAEIDAIFDLFVWSYLEKLPTDSIHSPTPLLKLFLEWSKNSRYHILLAKCCENNSDLTTLPYIFKLMIGKNTGDKVMRALMEFVEKLLLLEEDVDAAMEVDKSLGIPITVTHVVKIDQSRLKLLKLDRDRCNYGTKLLLPYISDILSILKETLKRKNKAPTKRSLFILARVTELVTDSETCNKLVSIMLPIILKRTQLSIDSLDLQNMLTTMANVIKMADNPESFIRRIAPLFDQITDVSCRKLLCVIMCEICDRSKNTQLKKMVEELNAWNKRWLEQPDYDRRLQAFRELDNLIINGTLTMELGIIAIYHCYFFLKHDDDLAIRDNASTHLRSIAVYLVKQSQDNVEEKAFILDTVIFSYVTRAIKGSNAKSREESCLLLGELARECSDAHPILSDLKPLTCKEDREIDFFDNIVHMQPHRHMRALNRFCKIAQDYKETPNVRTMMEVILPVAQHYICNETYLKKAKMVEAAVEAIGCLCKFLPWTQYEYLLKVYLYRLKKSLEYQKQLVKLVIIILDGYHFDLSFGVKKSGEDDTVEDNEDVVEPVEEKEAGDEEEPAIADETLETIPAPKTDDVKAIDKFVVLTEKAAARLTHVLQRRLIPDLYRTICELTEYDKSIKTNQKKARRDKENEDIRRLPIALAIVKLLQKLPKTVMDSYLPKLLIKVSGYLKSTTKSIRVYARDILRKILVSLGVDYFENTLDHLRAILRRGFHVHVLSVTTFTLLDALKTEFPKDMVDGMMSKIIDICINDIFGAASEEKEVSMLTRRTPEAKPSKKSFLIINILASNIGESSILDLVIPFKELLIATNSKRTVQKLQECFQQMVKGFFENPNISLESILMFIYGTISESIPDLISGTVKPQLTAEERERQKRARPDTFIVPAEPKRKSALNHTGKINAKTNIHVLIEFGLELLFMLLKRKKLLEIDYAAFLDPIISILVSALTSNHVRVTTVTINCLSSMWNTKLEIDKLEASMPVIVGEMFKILHKYATAGLMRKDENFHLVNNTFKAIVTILRYCKYYTFSEEQMVALLLYVEQDISNSDKQSIAFTLLNAIVQRKLVAAELNNVMKKVSQICIISDSSATREEARSIVINYLMNYPIGKKIDGIVEFFVAQLNYEVLSGRESAIKMLQFVIKKFPETTLNRKSDLLFMSLGARLVNEESTDCRVLVAETLELLLSHINKSTKDELFKLAMTILSDRKTSHRELGAQLCNRFIEVEKEEISKRLAILMPAIVKALTNEEAGQPGMFVRANRTDMIADSDDEPSDDDGYNSDTAKELKLAQKQRAIDHQIIQVLNTLKKIFEHCAATLESEKMYHEYLDELAYQLQKLLGYEHLWVRKLAANLLEHILSGLDYDKLQQIILNGTNDTGRTYLYSNPKQEIKSLVLDLCAQLIPGETEEEMILQVTKNLLFLANAIQVVSIEKNEEEDDEDGTKNVNLNWLIRRLRYMVHAEVTKTPKEILLRKSIFKWIEAAVALLDSDVIKTVAKSLLTPLIREMADGDHVNKNLQSQAIKVGNTIKAKIGDHEYDKLLMELQSRMNIKKLERKKQIAQDKVKNPVKAAMRKENLQKRKKEGIKRKKQLIRDNKLPKSKRKRMEDLF